MRRKIIIGFMCVIGLNVFGQNYYSTYKELVESIKKDITTIPKSSDRLTFRDSENRRLTEYHCNDTVFSDSCSIRRITNLDREGRIVSDSCYINTNNGELIFSIANIQYFPNFTLVKEYRSNIPEEVRIDSLVFDNSGELIERFNNEGVFQIYTYDKKNRIIRSEEYMKDRLRKEFMIDYTKDSIIETERKHYYRGFRERKFVRVFDKKGRLIERYNISSETRYSYENNTVNRDSIVSFNADLSPNKMYFIHPDKNTIIRAYSDSERKIIKTYQDGKIGKSINYSNKEKPITDSTYHTFTYYDNCYIIFYNQGDGLTSTTKNMLFENGDIKEQITKVEKGDVVKYSRIIRNKAGFTLKEYEFLRGKLKTCRIGIEQKNTR